MTNDLTSLLFAVVQDSVDAGASYIRIALDEPIAGVQLSLTAADNRSCSRCCGSAVEQSDRFLQLQQAAKWTGGTCAVRVSPAFGVTIDSAFFLEHPLCPPLGNIAQAVAEFVGRNPSIHLQYQRSVAGHSFQLDTIALSEALLALPLDHPEALAYLQAKLNQQEQKLWNFLDQSEPGV